MSYNIPLSATPSFSSVAGRPPAFQDWSFDPDSILEVVNFLGTGNPANITVDTIIKDYRSYLQIPATTQIFIQIEVIHPVLNGIETPWLTVSGDIASATGNGYEVLSSNREVDTILSFNTTSIPKGTTTTRVIFKAYTQPDGGQLTLEEETNYYVKLIRLNTGDVTITPSDLITFHHEIGSALPSGQSRTVNTGAGFTVTINDHIAITSDGDLAFDSEEEGIKTYSGSGTQELTFTLEASIEGETETDPYYYAEAIVQTETGSIDVQGIKVYVHSNEEDVSVTPDTMEFTAIKGHQQAGAQKIFIRGIGAWSIEYPTWMALNGAASGSNDADKNIAPLPYQNLTPGVYTGTVVVTMAGEVFNIAVKHTLIDEFDVNLENNTLYFTKDRDRISRFYGDNQHKVTISLTTETKEYETLDSKTKYGEFVRGIYNNKTDFWIGDVVHKIMASLKDSPAVKIPLFLGAGTGASSVFGSLINYYNPSSTDASIYSTNTVGISTDPRSFYNIRFLKGRKPSRINAFKGVLDYLGSNLRVTPTSFAYLNLYNNSTTAIVKVFKNGVHQFSKTIANDEHQLFGIGLKFSTFTPGDVIEARYYYGIGGVSDNTEYFSQKYIVFPEGKHSYHVGWEDEHGLLQLLEFTGDYSIESEYEGITIDTFNEYLERTDKAETIRQGQLTANTGWLLKENQERISSLLQAKRAWVFTPSGQRINVIPKSGSLSSDDSERANWAHVLKFKINPEHANQDYTF